MKSDAEKTIESMTKINDFPFYTAKYYGDYKIKDLMKGAVKSPADVVPFFEKLFSDLGLPAKLEMPGPAQSNGGCSAFFCKTAEETVLVGKNIDWKRDPLLLLKTTPYDGYNSLSLTNLNFCDLFQLNSLDHKLLLAPYVPLDGMNEHGLIITMLAVHEGSEYSYSQDKLTVGDFNIIRIILDTCKDVDEAIGVFRQYNIKQTGLLPIHYLVADKNQSCIIEFSKGEMNLQISSQENYLTNFNKLNNPDYENQRDLCKRYCTIEERFNRGNGSMETPEALKLLKEVSVFQPEFEVPSTICSLLYNPRKLNIIIQIGKEPKSYSVHLKSNSCE